VAPGITIRDRDSLEIVPRVEGYRVELPDERLEARFGFDHLANNMWTHAPNFIP
jgi:hypothetical protein